MLPSCPFARSAGTIRRTTTMAKALGPSDELHAAAYGKTGPALEFADYQRRFLEEMGSQRYWI